MKEPVVIFLVVFVTCFGQAQEIVFDVLKLRALSTGQQKSEMKKAFGDSARISAGRSYTKTPQGKPQVSEKVSYTFLLKDGSISFTFMEETGELVEVSYSVTSEKAKPEWKYLYRILNIPIPRNPGESFGTDGDDPFFSPGYVLRGFSGFAEIRVLRKGPRFYSILVSFEEVGKL